MITITLKDDDGNKDSKNFTLEELTATTERRRDQEVPIRMCNLCALHNVLPRARRWVTIGSAAASALWPLNAGGRRCVQLAAPEGGGSRPLHNGDKAKGKKVV